MNSGKFDIGEALRFGWDMFKNNVGLMLGITLIPWAVSTVASVFQNVFVKSHLELMIIIQIASVIIGIVFSIGIIGICLRLCDGERAQINDLLAYSHLVWRYLGASLLYTLIVICGLIFLIVPGIYLAVKFAFWPYFIVDKEVGITESLRRSWEMAEGIWLDLFIFWIVMFVVQLLGVLACCVGVLVSIPIVAVATAVVYRQLLSHIEPPQETSIPPVTP